VLLVLAVLLEMYEVLIGQAGLEAERMGEWCAYVLASSLVSASQAARWTARQGVGSHPVPIALTGLCSIPVV
jgi:hypothetical protein